MVTLAAKHSLNCSDHVEDAFYHEALSKALTMWLSIFIPPGSFPTCWMDQRPLPATSSHRPATSPGLRSVPLGSGGSPGRASWGSAAVEGSECLHGTPGPGDPAPSFLPRPSPPATFR
ncbi:unnamed protein product [Pipistrellus nathusii]|uniref:Uncharacterized protein n=1 Tax=Pipistrellus nathusii TaxID=59473 RepID=A0ABN9ZPN7_PIPNA